MITDIRTDVWSRDFIIWKNRGILLTLFLHNKKDRNIQKLYKRLERLLNCQFGHSCAGIANLTKPEVLMIPRNNYYQIKFISVHSELVALRIKHEPKIPWFFSLVRILQLPRQMCFFFTNYDLTEYTYLFQINLNHQIAVHTNELDLVIITSWNHLTVYLIAINCLSLPNVYFKVEIIYDVMKNWLSQGVQSMNSKAWCKVTPLT